MPTLSQTEWTKIEIPEIPDIPAGTYLDICGDNVSIDDTAGAFVRIAEVSEGKTTIYGFYVAGGVKVFVK